MRSLVTLNRVVQERQLILLGFPLQLSMSLTFIMFPILLLFYVRLADIKETEMRKRFGAEFDAYTARLCRTHQSPNSALT